MNIFDKGRNARAVFLVGFMGAGKTSVGRLLAARRGWRFLDLDEVVQGQGEGAASPELFRQAGEAAFRRAESAALLQLLADMRQEAVIVALGGGTFVQPENARSLQASGAPVVFLDAPLEELRRRCQPLAGTRPLFQDETNFANCTNPAGVVICKQTCGWKTAVNGGTNGGGSGRPPGMGCRK